MIQSPKKKNVRFFSKNPKTPSVCLVFLHSERQAWRLSALRGSERAPLAGAHALNKTAEQTITRKRVQFACGVAPCSLGVCRASATDRKTNRFFLWLNILLALFWFFYFVM